MTYTIGIDPGYDRIGIAVIKNEKKPKVVFSECFSPKKIQSYQEKVHNIGSHIIEIIKEYKPTDMSIEKVFFGNNKKTAMDVSGVRGVVIYCAMKENIPVAEYSPTQIKMAVTGFGRANKEQVKKMVYILADINKEKKRIDDEIDAIAIAMTHAACKNNI